MGLKLKMIGTDPEFFVSSNGKIISSQEAMIEGDKYLPFVLSDKASVHRDNVMIELGITPSESEDDFVSNISHAVSKAEEVYGIKLVAKASHSFSRDYLESIPEAMEFGCDPEYSAYEESDRCIKPPNPRTNIRSGGGHIHISYGDDIDLQTNKSIAMAMDIYLGIPSVILDKDKRRMKLYGSPGAYRNKQYGVEYRTLSNFWLGSEELIRWAYKNTVCAFDFVLENYDLIVNKDERIFSLFNESKSIIQEKNEDKAMSFISEIGIPMP